MKIEKVSFYGNYNAQLKTQSQKKNDNRSISNNQELSNVYYKPISFGRRIEEHRSWGARINPDTKEVSFKIFTYPDSKRVTAVVTKKDNPDIKKEFELENKGKGVFEIKGISPDEVQAGDGYQFRIHKGNGDIDLVKDPYSFRQDELNGASVLYDHSEFDWQYDNEWKNNPNRITRTSNGRDGKKSVREARIYELSPDCLTDKRSFDAVKSKLKEIKDTGFNTIEVMHVENTYSFNWGYDGVDKMAASSYLGGPDKLKELVDEAHKEGLNVVFDIIPNHLGPDGAQLKTTGPYIKGPNDFGEAFNFEGADSEYVKDYIINAAMSWVENYHVDGLRLDMTKYMQSDNTLKQLAAEINYHNPDCFIIAEDGRGGVSVDNASGKYWSNPDEVHDKRVVNPLRSEEYGKGESQDEHARKIEKLINGEGNLSRLGMDSEWDFNFYHELDSALYSSNEGVLKAALNAQHSVKYVMSHDEIGNFEGTRKLAKLMVPKLRLNDNINLSKKDTDRAKKYAKKKHMDYEQALQTIRFQKAQFAAETLATKYQTGELEEYRPGSSMDEEEKMRLKNKFYAEVLSPIGISSSSKIDYMRIKLAFDDSYAQNKMALALTYGIPGAKMVFQGDENVDLTPFRFFRRFQSMPHEDYLYVEKGYRPAEEALDASTFGKTEYSKDGMQRMEQYRALTKDLNTLNEENPALTRGFINNSNNSLVDHKNGVIAFHTKDDADDNEIFVITNFGDKEYSESGYNEYYIPFPQGRWVEVLNTDDEKYGGSSNFLNEDDDPFYSEGQTKHPINLGKYSTLYFKRID